jgi:hypothetical protein
MNYNINVYRGRKMFNLNFSARTNKQAFAKLRWVLWYCPNNGRKWRKSIENLAKSYSEA